MDPILSLGKESLKRLCFAGEWGQRYPVFTPPQGWALHTTTSRFQHSLCHPWSPPITCSARRHGGCDTQHLGSSRSRTFPFEWGFWAFGVDAMKLSSTLLRALFVVVGSEVVLKGWEDRAITRSGSPEPKGCTGRREAPCAHGASGRLPGQGLWDGHTTQLCSFLMAALKMLNWSVSGGEREERGWAVVTIKTRG